MFENCSRSIPNFSPEFWFNSFTVSFQKVSGSESLLKMRNVTELVSVCQDTLIYLSNEKNVVWWSFTNNYDYRL